VSIISQLNLYRGVPAIGQIICGDLQPRSSLFRPEVSITLKSARDQLSMTNGFSQSEESLHLTMLFFYISIHAIDDPLSIDLKNFYSVGRLHVIP
jgi:hypothetical protein